MADKAVTKTCSKCKIGKPRSEFYASKKAKDGLRWSCKSCSASEYTQWRKDNPTYWSDRHAENPERERERAANFNENSPGYWRDYSRRYRKKNPARQIRERISRGVRRSVVSGKPEGVFRHLPYTLDELVGRLGETMPQGYTWDDLPSLHIDHIRPVSSFDMKEVGDNEFLKCWAMDNLQLLPASENLSKGSRTDYKVKNQLKETQDAK